MAIELIGMTGGHPELAYPAFVNPAVMAVVNNPNLERIISQGLEVMDDGRIPFEDARQLIQMSREVRQASRRELSGFREIVVYLGKKRNNTNRVSAIPFVGVERSVPIPFAGRTDAILDDLSPESDILIVHLHPLSPEASDEDLNALLAISRALSITSERAIRASLLIIGEKDNEGILHTFDSKGRYITINLEDLLVRELLSQPLLDKLFLLQYRDNRFDKAADSFKPTWYGDGKLFPPEIPGKGLLFPGYFNTAPSSASIPTNAILREPAVSLYVAHTAGEKGKLPVVYVERSGIIQPLELQFNGRQYSYLLNGIPCFLAPNSLFPSWGDKINIPGSIKIADYQINLTGGSNIHKVDVLSIPTELLK